VFIDLIQIDTLKMKLTFKLDKDVMDSEIDTSAIKHAGIGNDLLNGILNTALTVTDSPLTFNFLMITDMFAPVEELMSRLNAHYRR